MKARLVILALFLSISAFGQLKFGVYKLSSDTVEALGFKLFSRLTLNEDSTFKYEYRTTFSAQLWSDHYGRWNVEGVNLTLIDSIRSYHSVDETILTNIKRTTTYLINYSHLIFLRQEFSNNDLIPIRELRGDFEFIEE